MQLWELESQIVSKNSEFDAAAGRLWSAECRLRFAEDAVSLMQEQVQS